MRTFKTFLFATVVLSLCFVSCGERQYAFTGILTFDIVDDEGKPLKKEEAMRFELYPINDYHYVCDEIKVKEGEYLVYETKCYDVLNGKFDRYQRLRDINPPLDRILKLKGVVLADKNGEYKTRSYYFSANNFHEHSSSEGHLVYQITSTIRLEKK